jgi:hypothetical protein
MHGVHRVPQYHTVTYKDTPAGKGSTVDNGHVSDSIVEIREYDREA